MFGNPANWLVQEYKPPTLQEKHLTPRNMMTIFKTAARQFEKAIQYTLCCRLAMVFPLQTTQEQPLSV